MQGCAGTGTALSAPYRAAAPCGAPMVGVGFAMVGANILTASAVIAAVTAALSLASVYIGKFFGNALADKATLAGGVILILIGLKMAIF